jgi:hypothetical protein
MRRWIAVVVTCALIVAAVTPAAEAGGTAANVALGLAAFAVFTHLLGAAAYAYAPPPYPAVVYAPPPAVYAPPAYAAPGVVDASQPVTVARPAPQVVRVVQYPHGRYQLYGDGVTTAYQWVWIPAAPPPPPPPPAAR